MALMHMQAQLAVGAAMFSAAVARSNFAAAAPAAAAQLQLSVGALSKLHAAFMLGYLLGHLPSGWLSDNFGGARLLLAAGLVWSAITLAHALVVFVPPAAALPCMTVLRFSIGVTTAACVPGLGAALVQLLPEGLRGRGNSLAYGMLQLDSHAANLNVARPAVGACT